MKCFKCGKKLKIEYMEMNHQYPLLCDTCDENMFIFEGVEEYDGESEYMYKVIPLLKRGFPFSTIKYML